MKSFCSSCMPRCAQGKSLIGRWQASERNARCTNSTEARQQCAVGCSSDGRTRRRRSRSCPGTCAPGTAALRGPSSRRRSPPLPPRRASDTAGPGLLTHHPPEQMLGASGSPSSPGVPDSPSARFEILTALPPEQMLGASGSRASPKTLNPGEQQAIARTSPAVWIHGLCCAVAHALWLQNAAAAACCCAAPHSFHGSWFAARHALATGRMIPCAWLLNMCKTSEHAIASTLHTEESCRGHCHQNIIERPKNTSDYDFNSVSTTTQRGAYASFLQRRCSCSLSPAQSEATPPHNGGAGTSAWQGAAAHSEDALALGLRGGRQGVRQQPPPHGQPHRHAGRRRPGELVRQRQPAGLHLPRPRRAGPSDEHSHAGGVWRSRDDFAAAAAMRHDRDGAPRSLRTGLGKSRQCVRLAISNQQSWQQQQQLPPSWRQQPDEHQAHACRQQLPQRPKTCGSDDADAMSRRP